VCHGLEVVSYQIDFYFVFSGLYLRASLLACLFLYWTDGIWHYELVAVLYIQSLSSCYIGYL